MVDSLPEAHYELLMSDRFRRWLQRLRDRQVRARVNARLRRLAMGHFGDVRALGGGLYEVRLDIGPGYRLYFIHSGGRVIVLLAGGDKSTQTRDIEQARRLVAAWRKARAH